VFCASGQAGVLRNLATWEIVDQVLQVSKFIAKRGERVANVVYMGIGEPLANFANTLRSLRLINHEEGLQVGMRHIAVSTSGIVPAIRRLAREKLPIRLAISLHAANDALRSRLMPINEVYPLGKLLEACREYQDETSRRITFEYCLIRDVNDSDDEAHAVGRLLDGIHSLVNIIPLNPVEGYEGERPSPARIGSFQRIVESYGIKTTVRQTMGDDIDAACGQLRRNASRVLSGRTLSVARRSRLAAS
jgi:23S rRNA (adenine2503-C2)-methyltransferase